MGKKYEFLGLLFGACVMWSSHAYSEEPQCPFEETVMALSVEHAADDANDVIASGQYFSYIVGDGYAPSSPGTPAEWRYCIPTKMIFVGGDVIHQCRNERALREHTYRYAEKFNTVIFNHLQQLNDFQCTDNSEPAKAYRALL